MLPNLPALASDWKWEEIPFQFDGAGWLKILDADPTRWYFMIGTAQFVQFQVSTVPDAALQNGIGAFNGGPLEFKYKDLGPIIGQEWYAYANGSTVIGSILVASITLSR